MTNDTRDPRFATWIVATSLLFFVAVGIGFIWLPSAQPGASALDLWNVICRAVGQPVRASADSMLAAGKPASNVAWTAATREELTRGDAVRGAALATTCNNCHGVNGVSTDAAFPNLVGQGVAALYKQLEDFRSRKRDATVMGVYVDSLSQQDVLDIATHFASLRHPFVAATQTRGSADAGVYRLVATGDPMRGIAPCTACHGPVGLTPGAPGLGGQQRAYLEEQMQAFKAGRRRNDIGEQMRSLARRLTGDEIAMLAAYYASFGGVTGQ
jgi:cytochrome c553